MMKIRYLYERLKYENITVIEWILLLIITFLLGISATYGDIIATTYHSMNLWNCIVDGNSIFDFYSYNYQNGEVYAIADFWYQVAAIYDFPLYLIFAIWNIPLWIMEYCLKIDVFNSVICLFWAKSITILFGFFTVKVISLICKQLEIRQRAKLCSFILWSSCIYMTIVIVCAQYDIIGTFFMLLALYYYLKDEESKFIFWFAIAACFKYLPLFVFVPLLLLKEKKVWNIILKFIIVISISVGSNILFAIFGSLDGKTGTLKDFLLNLFSNRIAAGNNQISIFIFAYGFLCIFCYRYYENNILLKKRMSIWVCAVAFGIFFIGGNVAHYWIVLLLPFLCILAVMNEKNYYLNLIMEFIFSTAFILHAGSSYTGLFRLTHIVRTIITKLVGSISVEQYNISPLYDFVESTGWGDCIRIVLNSLFVTALIGILYINKPKDIDEFSGDMHRGILYLRIGINIAILMVPIIFYVRLAE